MFTSHVLLTLQWLVPAKTTKITQSTQDAHRQPSVDDDNEMTAREDSDNEDTENEEEAPAESTEAELSTCPTSGNSRWALAVFECL